MTKPPGKQPFSIVVGLEFKDAGSYALRQAGQVAHAVPHSEIHLVHVDKNELNEDRRKQLLGQLRLFVNEEAPSLGGLAGVALGIHLRSGEPVREILQLASDVSATMIIIGAHKGPHLKNWLASSVAHRLIEGSACPVLVAGPRPIEKRPEPAVEPPCPDCVRKRAESNRAVWWCERHSNHAAKAHTFSYQREIPFVSHDSEVIPTGIDFPGL